jgi:Phage major capsid protein E
MIVDDYIEPAVLTGFVREVPGPLALTLNRWLPDRQINDIEVAIDQVTRTNRAAKFRAWDSEVHVSKRDSFRRDKVAIPPLGVKLPIGEYERLMLERIRTGGDNRNGYVQAIYNDAAQLTREVLNRAELARGDVLVDGKFTLSGENGLFLEADFGVDADHLVTASVVWTNHASAVPLQDLRTWQNLYIEETGEKPGWALTSNTVVNNMLMSAEIRSLFYRGQTLASAPDIITITQLNQVLQAYGLPPLVEYDSRVEVDGVNTRVIPDDRLIFLPTDPTSLGFTAWGITAESLELAAGQNPSLEFDELPGLVGVVLKEGDPVRVWTKVGAVSMPIISDPRRLVVADVL